MRLELHGQDFDPKSVGDVVDKVVERDKLVLEVEGVMYMFPYANIKYIRISPFPETLPAAAIKGVHVKAT